MKNRKKKAKWEVCDGGCRYDVTNANRVRNWQTIATDFMRGFDVNMSADMSVQFDIYKWGELVKTVSRTAQPEKKSRYSYS